jgi:anti-sigma B factor antagonist
MALEIKVQRPAGTQGAGFVTVQLFGSLDTETSPELERQLEAILAGAVKDVIFDLARLRFVTSAGLRIFASTRKTLKERNGQASFVNLQPQIELVFDVMKSLPGVAVYKDPADLDRYLALLQCNHPPQG